MYRIQLLLFQPEQSFAPGIDPWDAGSQSSGAAMRLYKFLHALRERTIKSGIVEPAIIIVLWQLILCRARIILMGQGSAYPAPQISGPMQEQLTAEELGLSQPQMESFAPDASLGFVSASLPDNAVPVVSAPMQSTIQPSAQPSAQSSVQAALPGSSVWYYPRSVVSANRFFVQTASGFRTVGGCSFNGYLPLWADIKSSGNFFVYEWYPGRSTPSVRWWGWTGTGWKKGWFCGDVPGWHILCYNSGIWSNYIYIYVYPRGAAMSAPSGYSNAAASMTASSLPLDAPIPPDPGAERIVLPDYQPVQAGHRPVLAERIRLSCSGEHPAGGLSWFV